MICIDNFENFRNSKKNNQKDFINLKKCDTLLLSSVETGKTEEFSGRCPEKEGRRVLL